MTTFTSDLDKPFVPRPLAVGDRIHGYCGGYFGRDHYDCGIVEAVGKDWLIARTTAWPNEGRAFSATGEGILTELAEYRDNDKCTWPMWGDDERRCFNRDI